MRATTCLLAPLLLLTLHARAQAPTDSLALPAWLRPAPAAPAPKAFTPTEDEAEMCPLRPSRASILKIGFAPTRQWRRGYLASLPLVLGFERRITPDLSITASLGSAVAPWNRESSRWPQLRALDLTLGARLYLNSVLEPQRPRTEFAGPYVALEGRRSFVAQPVAGQPISTATYRFYRSSQVVGGYQFRFGGHGLLDAAAGLQYGRTPGATHTRLVPTASLTVGFVY